MHQHVTKPRKKCSTHLLKQLLIKELTVRHSNARRASINVEEGRELLRRIAAMLTALSKAVTYD